MDDGLNVPHPGDVWEPSLNLGNGVEKGAGGIHPAPFKQIFDLGICAVESNCPGVTQDFLPPNCLNDGTGDPADAVCEQAVEGLLPIEVINNLSTYFNTTMSGILHEPYMEYVFGEPWNHWIVAAPPADPNKWILTLENITDGGNADFNDIVIMLERKTGGSAGLKSVNALSPIDSNAYITKVSINVHDYMPGSGTCAAGETQIDYQLSVDDGTTWVDITPADWVVVRNPR